MSDGDAVELYRRYRPQRFADVIGQDEAVRSIVEMGKRNEIPHVMLFTGPSGCGKTTLARIIRKNLKCEDVDYQEINASDARGIDEIRGIRQRANLSPIGGPCRVIYLDECHGLTGDAQDAVLKLLEDTPSHLYIQLATTNEAKLKKTILTRATTIRCKALGEKDITNIIRRVLRLEDVDLSDAVIQRVAESSDGSGRQALVILHKIIGIKSEEDQLAAISSVDVKSQGIDIARLLLKKDATWKEVAEVLGRVEEDAEAIRRVIIGYAKAVLLKSGSARAALIIEEFREPVWDIGMPGVVASCFAIVSG